MALIQEPQSSHTELSHTALTQISYTEPRLSRRAITQSYGPHTRATGLSHTALTHSSHTDLSHKAKALTQSHHTELSHRTQKKKKHKGMARLPHRALTQSYISHTQPQSYHTELRLSCKSHRTLTQRSHSESYHTELWLSHTATQEIPHRAVALIQEPQRYHTEVSPRELSHRAMALTQGHRDTTQSYGSHIGPLHRLSYKSHRALTQR